MKDRSRMALKAILVEVVENEEVIGKMIKKVVQEVELDWKAVSQMV